jgi:hypothetical protein
LAGSQSKVWLDKSRNYAAEALNQIAGFRRQSSEFVFFRPEQGCQIFLGAWYQNRKNVPNEYKMYQMNTKCTK